MNAGRISGRDIVGVFIVVVGALLLLDTLGVLATENIVRWAPLLLVVLGVWQLVTNGSRNLFGPLLLIGIGVIIQLTVLDVVNDVWEFWPVVLIIMGVSVVLGRTRYQGKLPKVRDDDSENFISVFSGVKRRISSPDFKGCAATSLFGGLEIDLREAEIQTRPAVIDATVLFGGLEIKVPTDWVVSMDAMVLFAGNEDKRDRSGAGNQGEPHLVVTGTVLFGGIQLDD